MVRIEDEIILPLLPQAAFDLARDPAVHTLIEAYRGESAYDAEGRPWSAGLLSLGDEITFEARHFGVRQRLTARVVTLDAPHGFVDEMRRGAFRSLRHTHAFAPVSGGTLMRDTLEFSAPLGPLGWLAERLFLAAYMRRFLQRHQRGFLRLAEAGTARAADNPTTKGYW